VLAIFLVGAVFSYVRGRTGTLLAPYLMHLSYNTTLFVALYLSSGRFTRFS
jgi:membrane protease YdiL (CAAX protease family)